MDIIRGEQLWGTKTRVFIFVIKFLEVLNKYKAMQQKKQLNIIIFSNKVY